jgi:hypothetical protein
MRLSKYCIVEGRRPEGLVLPARSSSGASGGSLLGEYLAHAAFLDAASAVAFARLGHELALHGAPDRLVNGCERARLAELRHARSLGRLAERHGARPAMPKPRGVGAVRPLVDIALENIVEGFVRGTYGAAAARFRARAATDPELRSAMESIAEDECTHAELAFAIATWLQAEIDPVEGVWVEDALRHAVVALARELDVEVAAELSTSAGVPPRRDALAIWSGLSHRVWHGLSERLWSAAA